MTHIVFNLGDIELMKEVIALDESLAGEVLCIRDDFAVGPLAALDTEEGWNERVNWWMDKVGYSHYQENDIQKFDDRETIASLKNMLDENPEEELWIWLGQNQHDVTGYYWMMRQFSEYQGRIFVLYLNNLPFINEKGQIFYPSWLSEIRPSEFLKARKLSRAITASEFEVDPDEWKRLAEENDIVRMLEGGKKIVGKGEDFYDAEILKNLTGDWQKAWRLLSNTLHRMKIKTGDVFIEWRIRKLIEEGKIETNGNVGKNFKDFDVKKAGGKSSGEPAESAEENNVNA